MKRLNFGSGSIQPDDWDNVDIVDYGQEYVGSTELFKDDTYDTIVAHCVLQTFGYEELPKIIKELRRILKPGGRLYITMPDIVMGFKQYLINNYSWFPNSELDMDLRFSNWLTWYGTGKSLLTAHALMRLLQDSGFLDTWQNISNGRRKSLLDTRIEECYMVGAI